MGEHSTLSWQIFSASGSADFPLFPDSLAGYTKTVVDSLHNLLLTFIGMGVCLWLGFLFFEVRSVPLTFLAPVPIPDAAGLTGI